MKILHYILFFLGAFEFVVLIVRLMIGTGSAILTGKAGGRKIGNVAALYSLFGFAALGYFIYIVFQPYFNY
jgi:hypothetical protein